ncbi:MAG: arsenite methyltransferase [Bacteroidales bacterium]|nr:arsenite methyltransferase [Bacteroidales bacterium]
MKAEDLKLIVRDKYAEIASQSIAGNQSSCCGGTNCCSDKDYTIFSDDYSHLEGYNPDADLKLGCGIPTEFARINEGDSVLDLGSGAGNDCFVARALVGTKGKVTGIDFTDEMLEKARNNLSKLGYKNIEFIKGDIESMPLPDSRFDVVLSNCVLNLVPDKEKAFSEIFRVLKQGGHFCISDVVIIGDLPEKLKKTAELYVGCISGALQKEKYLKIIKDAGFSDINVKREVKTVIPDEILYDFLSDDEIKSLKTSGLGIISITVTGYK